MLLSSRSIVGLFLMAVSQLGFAENGCIIKNAQDATCSSGRRLFSSLDFQLNVCAPEGSDLVEISGLYCRSSYQCFRDDQSAYSDGDSTFSWYNCYYGAVAIPASNSSVTQPNTLPDLGCVIKNVRDTTCQSGRRLHSSLDNRLTSCASIEGDSAAILGAFCRSRYECFKDYKSVYQDGDTNYAWYNCYQGATAIFNN